MKTTHKKKKKKGPRKTNRSRPESKISSKSDPILAFKDKEEKGKNQQIISKSGTEKKLEKRNQITGYISVATQFLRDSKMELKKVKWPTRKELLASTAMVILLVLAIAFFLGLVDLGLIKIIRSIVG